MAETPSKKAKMSTNQLEQLKKFTVVVADTGDIDSIKQFKPTDATTNPSLILASATKPQYEHLLKEAISFAKSNASSLLIENFLDSSNEKSKSNGATEKEVLDLAIDKVCVNFGLEILKLVDGVVSTEVDARLSFDTDLSVARARRIIKLYENNGIKKERILIKLASTWEGFQAAKILKKENIKCNMTLLFSFSQAIIAAQEEVELISPFVGRILDWNKKKEEKNETKITSWIDNPSTDPGVLSVKKIYNYYKKHGIKTIVMGASFRNKGEILELSGCDKLTIGPKFLKELENSEENFEVKLTQEKANESKEDMEKIVMNEKEFRWALNEDQMATEKLSEGIRKFAIDIVKLENIIKERLD